MLCRHPGTVGGDMDQMALEDRLRAKVDRDSGGSHRLLHFHIMPEGHAGLTFGYTTIDGAGHKQDLVLKIAPPGVARRGNTDVYRQGLLLRTLHAAGLAVPDVPFDSDGEDELGSPYIVMESLPGRTFVVWEPHPSFDLSPGNISQIWQQAATALAGIHAYPWRDTLSGWQVPRKTAEELAYWPKILDKAQEPRWIEKGRKLADALGRWIPPDGPIGVIHGDYQPGNVLYDGTRLTGIIDWELTGIGAQTIDLGWLSMMNDPLCWQPEYQPAVALSRDEIVAHYETARGHRVEHLDWFEALACYRMGAIACLNVRLHRTGRRIDAMWDRFAPSIDTLFERGLELCTGPQNKTNMGLKR